MPKPLSQDVRNQIIYHKKNGESNVDIARWLLINERSVRRIWNLYKTENTINPKAHNKGRKPAFGDDILDKIKARIKEKNDILLSELIDEFDLKISVSALSRKLIKHNINFKKRRCFQKSSNEKMSKYSVKNG